MKEFIPRIRISEKGPEIFDAVRKKFVAITPEEVVRQQLLHFLVHAKKFPEGLLGVEIAMTFNNCRYRADVVAYDRSGKPLMIAECKAPKAHITQNVFEQIGRYNLVLKVPFMLVSNGVQHFFCRYNAAQNSYCFEEEMPDYNALLKLAEEI
jgi:type I site-specific restriction endonuclease